MALYVYITPQCESEVKSHQLEDTVLNFKQRILEDQSTTLFDRYPPPYLKKRFKRQDRLIAAEISISDSDDVVVVFLRMFVRGGKEYENFKNDPKGFGEKYFRDLIDESNLKLWLNENREIERPTEKLSPSEEENAFLWNILSQESSLNLDEFIFETEEWQKGILDNYFQNRLNLLPKQLLKFMFDSSGCSNVAEIGSGIKVLYRNFPTFKKLFLAGIFKDKKEASFDELNRKYDFILNNNLVNEDDILRSCRRSYPGLILADEDIWIDIQKNMEANLALSPEESQLLASVYKTGDTKEDRMGFPLFINGRAGSGKSTILQYLFSDYLGFYISENITTIKPPIYLTYSKDLVEKSKISVSNILSKNYKHSINRNISIEKDDLNIISKSCFVLFRDLLIQIIRQSGIKEMFDERRYIDYKEFKSRWKQKFQTDPKAFEYYGPDISWHIIRTYVKGYSISGFIDEEEYEELPRDERTVSRETFKLVYQKVWNNWYKYLCDQQDENQGYWDDQDIVRFIIDNKLVKSEYPAIFCDEAQDFTRIELEFLFRSSIFSNRKVTGQDINRVPFVFAGDPFQTLNPTGFNWDNIKAAFVQKFIYSLDPKVRFGNPQLHYEELTFNYRSSKNIVKLCNNIQALRALLFGHKKLEPQTTWQFEERSRMPVYFNSEENDVWEKIREFPDLRIIVPCAEGEEPEFVKNDQYLSKIIQTDETGVPRNVMSPMRSKGLEFERVIVYGFGIYSPERKFFDSLKNLCESEDEVKREKMLSYEYYLNQLYVSVSRAQRMLIIVDSTQGLGDFWNFGIDPEYMFQLYSESGVSMTSWEDAIGVLSRGTKDVWTGNIEDRAAIALRLDEEGRDKQDPYMLRQAAMIYRDMNLPLKEKECKAFAYTYEKKYEDAARCFLECNQINDAISYYWKAKNYNKLREIGNNNPQVSTDIRIRASNQERESQISATISLLRDFIDKYASAKDLLLIIGEETWPLCIQKILDNLLSSKNETSTKEWKNLAVLIEAIVTIGVINTSKYYAQLLIRSGDYQKAIKIFEDLGETSSQDYQNAIKKVVQEKLKATTNDNTLELSDTEKRIAGNYLIEQQKYIEAVKLFHEIQDVRAINEIIVNAYKSEGDKSIEHLLTVLFSTYFNQKQFRQALSYIDTNPKTEIKALPYFNYLQSKKEFWIIYFTKEFAVTPYLQLSSQIEQIKVSEFLRMNYLENQFINWKLKIHPLVVGSAMERAGKDLDCLKYYGGFEDSKEFGGLLSIEAKKRLAAIKIRQSLREENERKLDLSVRHRSEAESKAKELGIELKDIPDFPSISQYLSYGLSYTKDNSEKPSVLIGDENQDDVKEAVSNNFTELKLFSLDIKISRVSRKIQFSSTNLSTLSLNMYKGNYVYDDVEVIEEGDDLVISEWNIRINGYKNCITYNYLIVIFVSQKVELKIFL